MSVYMSACVRVCACAHVHVCLCVCVRASTVSLYASVCLFVYMHMCVGPFTRACVYIHVHNYRIHISLFTNA